MWPRGSKRWLLVRVHQIHIHELKSTAEIQSKWVGIETDLCGVGGEVLRYDITNPSSLCCLLNKHTEHSENWERGRGAGQLTGVKTTELKHPQCSVFVSALATAKYFHTTDLLWHQKVLTNGDFLHHPADLQRKFKSMLISKQTNVWLEQQILTSFHLFLTGWRQRYRSYKRVCPRLTEWVMMTLHPRSRQSSFSISPLAAAFLKWIRAIVKSIQRGRHFLASVYGGFTKLHVTPKLLHTDKGMWLKSQELRKKHH